MKACLFFILVVAVIGFNAHTVHLNDKEKEQANEIIMQCKETGVTDEVIEEAKKGRYSEDEGLKKFTLCYFNKLGIMTPDAKLNIDVAIASLHPAIDKTEAKNVLEECNKKNGKDAVDTAFQILKCYNEGMKSHVLY